MPLKTIMHSHWLRISRLPITSISVNTTNLITRCCSISNLRSSHKCECRMPTWDQRVRQPIRFKLMSLTSQITCNSKYLLTNKTISTNLWWLQAAEVVNKYNNLIKACKETVMDHRKHRWVQEVVCQCKEVVDILAVKILT